MYEGLVSVDEKSRQNRAAALSREAQEDFRQGLHNAQRDLRDAQLRATSALIRLEDLDRPEITPADFDLLVSAGVSLADLQIRVRKMIAGIDVEAPLPYRAGN